MEIITLSEFTTKVFVPRTELLSMKLSSYDFQNLTFSAKLFLLSLCNTLGKTFSKNTTLEIFDLDEGIVLYFSNPKPKNHADIYMLVQTKNLRKLSLFSKKLSEDNIDVVVSKLYSDKENPSVFRLCLKLKHTVNLNQLKSLACNFQQLSFEKSLCLQTAEHSEKWELLLGNNALGFLSEVT